MTPDERQELEQLRETVNALQQGLDPNFIAAIKRFAVGDQVTVNASGGSAGSTTGTADGVSVALAHDSILTLEDADGNTYKVPVYN